MGGVKWINVNKGDVANLNHRSCLVGGEFNEYRDDAQYASTPSIGGDEKDLERCRNVHKTYERRESCDESSTLGAPCRR